MNERFFDLNKEKQDRILESAFSVFALHGYADASTDAIVKEASISKGLLFHYFGSKYGLFSFLVDYASRYASLELRSGVRDASCPYEALQEQILEAVFHIQKQYPSLLLFLNRIRLEDLSAVCASSEEADALLEKSSRFVNDCFQFETLCIRPAGYSPESLRVFTKMFYTRILYYLQYSLTKNAYSEQDLKDLALSCLSLLKPVL